MSIGHVAAQSSLPGAERTSGSSVEAAFEPQRAVLQQSSAVIYDGYKSSVYGIVVAKDGYILTKSSLIDDKKEYLIRIGEDVYQTYKVVARDPRWDLALLKIEAEQLEPIAWADSSNLPQGSWVVANGSTSRKRRRVSIGIISAHTREVGGESPVVMGVGLKAADLGLEIAQVSPKTGAEAAGLKKGDILVEFDGVKVTTRDALIEKIRDKVPGDIVDIVFLRKGEKNEAKMELMARHDAFEQNMSRNDQMSGRFSKRRNNFPLVLQTDVPFNDRTVGGPLLNLDGKCIGLNIARANRAESFAVPVEEIKGVLKGMLEKVAK